MLNFFIFYATILILSAICINGWFAITRGRWETLPNGRKYWTGKLFNFWHRFLQKHTLETEYYKKDALMREFAKIRGFFRDEEIVRYGDTSVVVTGIGNDKITKLSAYAASVGVKVKVNDGFVANTSEISIYTDVPKYFFPYHFSDPLGLCLTCMSSFYGTLLWVFWFTLATNINVEYPTDGVSAFLALSLKMKVALWVIFCVCLAYLNDLFLKFKK